MKPHFLAITLTALCSFGFNSAMAEEEVRPAIKLLKAIDYVETAKQAAAGVMAPMIEQLKAQGLPDAAIKEFTEAADKFFTITFEDPDMEGEMAAIYEKHFTNEELEELLIFYQTPLGKKTLLTMPEVMQEGMQVGQKFAAKNQEKFQNEVRGIMEKYMNKPDAEPAE